MLCLIISSPVLSCFLVIARVVTIDALGSSDILSYHVLSVYYLLVTIELIYVTSPRLFSGNKNALSCMRDAAWRSHQPVSHVTVWVSVKQAQTIASKKKPRALSTH